MNPYFSNISTGYPHGCPSPVQYSPERIENLVSSMKKKTSIPENRMGAYFSRIRSQSFDPNKSVQALELSTTNLEPVRKTFATRCVEAESGEDPKVCEGVKGLQSAVCNTRVKNAQLALV